MKILMTTDTVGGVWTYSLQLAGALAQHDVHVTLAAKGVPTPAQRAAAQGLENVCLEVGRFKLEWMDDPWDDVAEAGEWLQELAGQVRPDIVHLNDYCHGSLPWEAPLLMVGHSCVMSWMAAVRGTAAGPQWDRYRREVRRGLQAADLVVAPTRHMLSELDRHHGPLRAREAILNGSAAGRFWRMSKQPFVFSAGRLWDEGKNLATLAAAAPDLRWPVGVAGLRGPDGQDGWLDSVEWLGQLDADEMAAAYAVAAIYALPALYEPFGLSVLEAALSGCALVLGDIPTLREIWGKAACYVPPRNVRRLTATINGLIEDPARREQLAHRAYRRARQLSAEKMAAAYYNTYCRLAVRRRQVVWA